MPPGDFSPVPPVPQKVYSGQGKFPQPVIVAIGFVTSGGSTGSFITPTGFTVSRASAGVYTLTHKIGMSNKYVVVPTPVSTTAAIITADSYGADTVTIRTFNDAGTATDTAFSFVIYSF